MRESLHAPRYIVLLTPTPCDAQQLGTTYVSSLGHPEAAAAQKEFYLEPVVRDGDQLHLCGAALDAKGTRVIGFGAYAKNPITFRREHDEKHGADEKGEEEDDDLQMRGLEVTVTKLGEPVVLPFDRF